MEENKIETVEKKDKKKELIRALKFFLFSCSAGIIQFGSNALLELLFGKLFAGKWDELVIHWVSYLIGLVLSVIWNFTFNRKFTFKSATNVPIAMLKIFGYYTVFTPLSVMLDEFLNKTWTFPGAWALVTFICMFINLITEYPFDTFVVFRGTIDQTEKKKEENAETEETQTETDGENK